MNDTANSDAVDIVVTYANADRARLEPLVAALRSKNLTVWWADPERNGKRWRDEIEERMEEAKCVVAAWSKASSSASSNVFLDASIALESEKLVSIRLDPVDLPWGYRDQHAIDVSLGPNLAASEGFNQLLQVVVSARSSDLPQVERPFDDLKGLANRVAKAALERQEVVLWQATSELVAALASDTTGLQSADVAALLNTLRDQRAHQAVISIAEAAISRENEPGETRSIKIRRFYAQSLIDTNQLNAAIDHLSATAITMPLDHPEYPEVMGLLGRAHKQIYINDKRAVKSARSLRLALDFYADAVRGTIRRNSNAAEQFDDTVRVERDVWNGINVIALQALADKDKVAVQRYCDPEADAIKMIAVLNPLATDPWEQATIGECYVTCGQFSKAAEHYSKFLANSETTPFHINSALRQLKEIRQLNPAKSDEGGLLAGFEARMVTALGGSVHFSAADLAAYRSAPKTSEAGVYDSVFGATIGAAAANAGFETVIGAFESRPRQWFQVMLERSSAVGRVVSTNGTIGSGFLVDGGQLDPRLEGESLFLTNAHVVSGGKAEQGLERLGMHRLPRPPSDPYRVRIKFDVPHPNMPPDGYPCRLVWESPAAEMDVSVLRFTYNVAGIEPCRLADSLPPLKVKTRNGSNRNARVFVIGHPSSGDLAISIEDCGLRQIGPKSYWGDQYQHIDFLHYRTPTEEGSSGSPVFEENHWDVIAIHHFGSGNGQIPSLDGNKHWRANEGVSIASIRNAIRKLSDKELKLPWQPLPDPPARPSR